MTSSLGNKWLLVLARTDYKPSTICHNPFSDWPLPISLTFSLRTPLSVGFILQTHGHCASPMLHLKPLPSALFLTMLRSHLVLQCLQKCITCAGRMAPGNHINAAFSPRTLITSDYHPVVWCSQQATVPVICHVTRKATNEWKQDRMCSVFLLLPPPPFHSFCVSMCVCACLWKFVLIVFCSL